MTLSTSYENFTLDFCIKYFELYGSITECDGDSLRASHTNALVEKE